MAGAKALAVAIIVLAAVVRLWGLGEQSIWQDEAYSVVLARHDVGTIIQTQVEDSSPPLYYLLLHIWIRVFGDSEFCARLLSALFGIGLVAATLMIASRLFTAAVGLWAGGMLAFAPLAVYYSQEARMYSLTPLLAIMSVYLCCVLTETPTPKRMAWFIAVTAAMLYTQNYGVFVLLAEGLYLLARRKESRDARPMLALMGVVGAYLPWLLVLSRQVAENTTPWILEPRVRMLFETFLHLTFKSWRLPTTGFLKALWGIGLLAVAASLVLAVRLALRGRRSTDASQQASSGRVVLMLSYTFVPIACAFVGSYSKPLYVPGRYDTIVQPGLFILAALGLTSIRVKRLRKALGVLAFAVLIISLHSYFTTYWKSNDRAIAHWVEKEATASDIVLFTDLTITPFMYYCPESSITTLRFPRGGLGWTPKGAFTDDAAFFEEEFGVVERRIAALWPQKTRLLVVFKPMPAIYQRLKARLDREDWLQFEKREPFEMGHNVENQVSEVLIFRIVGPPPVDGRTTNDTTATEMR